MNIVVFMYVHLMRLPRTSVFLFYTLGAGEANMWNLREGELTQRRSRVVGNKNLFQVATSLQLGDQITFST
jgi:dsRNA-specific ribonuclease